MGLSYSVQHSDLSKTPIWVNDQTINDETSVSLIGDDYFNYGPALATNFLHLLENFANSDAPTNAIQGQLWFDTSKKQLMINTDGIHWNTAGSVSKSISKPTDATIGDIWVDIINQQLYVYKGAGTSGDIWTLVGPDYSQGSITGQKIQKVVDTINGEHNIIELYSDTALIAIVGNKEFTPKIKINGFQVIKAGITLNTQYKLNGTATNAEALGNIPSTSFFRIDQDNNMLTGKSLSVDNINIGIDRKLTISSETVGVTSQHNIQTTGRDLRVINNDKVITIFTSDNKVGINTSAPTEILDVNGTTKSVKLSITDTSDSSISSLGGLSIAKNTILRSNLTVTNGLVTIGNIINTIPQVGPIIIPDSSVSYDIGSISKQFRNIYSKNFNGDLIGDVRGNVTGNVLGVATRAAGLQYPTEIKLKGDVSSNVVSFDGVVSSNHNVGNLNIVTTLSADTISNKDEVLDFLKNDYLLLQREYSATAIGYITQSTLTITNMVYGKILPNFSIVNSGDVIDGTTILSISDDVTMTISIPQMVGSINAPISLYFRSPDLYKISRTTLVSTFQLIGSITLVSWQNTATPYIPAGYLLCDGTAYSRIIYKDLFDEINTTHGAGDASTTFNVPNLTAPGAYLSYVICSGLHI